MKEDNKPDKLAEEYRSEQRNETRRRKTKEENNTRKKLVKERFKERRNEISKKNRQGCATPERNKATLKESRKTR